MPFGGLGPNEYKQLFHKLTGFKVSSAEHTLCGLRLKLSSNMRTDEEAARKLHLAMNGSARRRWGSNQQSTAALVDESLRSSSISADIEISEAKVDKQGRLRRKLCVTAAVF